MVSTAIMGSTFVGFQVYEFSSFANHHIHFECSEIAKDIEKSKVVKKSNYEYLYDKMMSPDPKDKAFAKSILKQDKDLGDFVEQHGTSTGYRLFVGKTMPEIKGTFAGDEKSIKELKTEELGDGKYYLAPPEDTFITIKGGKITKKEPGLV